MKYRIRKHCMSDFIDMQQSKIMPRIYYTIEKLSWKLWWMEHWTCITNFKPVFKYYAFNSPEEAKDVLKKYIVYIKELESNNNIIETIEL